MIRETRERTEEPFAVNLVLDEATTTVGTEVHLETALEAGAPIVSFSFGDAAPYVDRVHEAGALSLQTVGSAEAVAAGVDVVVTQDLEAGGHVQSEVATTALVPSVADAVGDEVPIVAAGGIADGRGVAAALVLGADGAWLGTRFVATTEANVHDEYQRRVRESDETDTSYTTVFDKGWPGMSHRVLENETLERWEAAGRPTAGERPGEDDVVARASGNDGDGDGRPIERYDEALATPDVDGGIGDMALYAGQSAGLTDNVRPADAVLETLVSEARETITRVGTSVRDDS